jgi:hypothetical protein
LTVKRPPERNTIVASFPQIDFGASLYQQRGGSDRTAASCEKNAAANLTGCGEPAALTVTASRPRPPVRAKAPCEGINLRREHPR